MNEKTKRKEKAKRRAFSGRFMWISAILLLVFVAGVLLWIPFSCACSIAPSEAEKNYINTQNAFALTQISATATAFMEAYAHIIQPIEPIYWSTPTPE